MPEPDWYTQAKAEGRILSDRQARLNMAQTPALPGMTGEAVGPGVQRFELPYPPTVNTYWRSIIMKSKYTGEPRIQLLISKRGRQFQRDLKWWFDFYCGKSMKGNLKFEADFHPPDKRRRDLDNLLKSIIDALCKAGAYENDDQIQEIHVRFGKPMKGGKSYVTLSQLPA